VLTGKKGMVSHILTWTNTRTEGKAQSC
jgi:hypothetical protein